MAAAIECRPPPAVVTVRLCHAPSCCCFCLSFPTTHFFSLFAWVSVCYFMLSSSKQANKSKQEQTHQQARRSQSNKQEKNTNSCVKPNNACQSFAQRCLLHALSLLALPHLQHTLSLPLPIAFLYRLSRSLSLPNRNNQQSKKAPSTPPRCQTRRLVRHSGPAAC